MFERTCHKIIYHSRQEAKNALRHYNKTTTHPYKRLQDVYFCHQCSAWHTTSMNKHKSRKLKKK